MQLQQEFELHPQEVLGFELQPQLQLLFELLFDEVLLGILLLIPAKNSGFCGGANRSNGKSSPSKKSHTFIGDVSSHSFGTQKPLDSTRKFTIL